MAQSTLYSWLCKPDNGSLLLPSPFPIGSMVCSYHEVLWPPGLHCWKRTKKEEMNLHWRLFSSGWYPSQWPWVCCGPAQVPCRAQLCGQYTHNICAKPFFKIWLIEKTEYGICDQQTKARIEREPMVLTQSQAVVHGCLGAALPGCTEELESGCQLLGKGLPSPQTGQYASSRGKSERRILFYSKSRLLYQGGLSLPQATALACNLFQSELW